MFENLTDRLSHTLQQLRGQGRLTEDNISQALREVRMALLEADVALPVVKQFIEDVKGQAVGAEVLQSLTPGQALVAVVQREMVKLLGDEHAGLELRAQPPAVVLMAGLQGSGKTTTTGKLARYLKEQKKTVLVVSADVYRPAAIEQLRSVAESVGVDCLPSETSQKPALIAKQALAEARRGFYDVLIVDTAGRLSIDHEMMQEIKELHQILDPADTLFVVDSMTGQDAANTARAFGEALPLTGVVLTKVDGDARGGAALSVRSITGKPIKFIGVGEKLDALEPFHPERMASRILGMGDVLSLVEEAERKIDKQKAEQLSRKLQKGKGFDLADFRDQMQQMQAMGGLSGLMDKLPGMGGLPGGAQAKLAQSQMGDSQITKMVAIVNSMTPQERRFPDVIRASRKRRIAAGSGTQVQDVNRLLKQFTQMQKMMKKFSKGGMAKMMRSMGGRMPPGMPPIQ